MFSTAAMVATSVWYCAMSHQVEGNILTVLVHLWQETGTPMGLRLAGIGHPCVVAEHESKLVGGLILLLLRFITN